MKKYILSVAFAVVFVLAYCLPSFGAGSANYLESYFEDTNILIVTWYCDDLTGGTVSGVGTYNVPQSGFIRYGEIVLSQTNAPGASWELYLYSPRATLNIDKLGGLGANPATDAVTSGMVVDSFNSGIVEVRKGEALTPYSTTVDTGAFSLSITIVLDAKIVE